MENIPNLHDVVINQHDTFGALWAIGWLFTIGFLRLSFWRGVLALFIWPYFIGVKYHKS